MNFWDEAHPLSAEYQRLNEQLVPPMGECDTLQGELLRAASKIGYDWYNNGWGCNNWSGAVVFLKQYAGIIGSARTPTERDVFMEALAYAHLFSHGEPAPKNESRADQFVTTIVAHVVQCILDNPTPIANTLDMWNFQEPDAPYEDEEEEDDWY